MTRKLAALLPMLTLLTFSSQSAHAQGSCVPQSKASIYINVTGPCTISGNLVATAGGITVVATGQITITGSVSATGGAVYISGNSGAAVSSTIGSTGLTTVQSSGGNVSIGGNVTSNGNVSIGGVNITTAAINSSGTINQSTTTGTLTATGALSSTSDTYLYAPGGISLQSTSSAQLYLRSKLESSARPIHRGTLIAIPRMR